MDEAERLARVLAEVVQGREVLLLATTDYAHAGGEYPEQPPAGVPLASFVRGQDEA
eukprot:CAMPEP_0204161108 /NCGR_PEP_ID=MMETSP0361-20130328/34454_1 /ASSEMBLY_ACC=CAM_ASM_000343 /TAXON_ID=268821 /ORGANISM="Scrippsiella Hangoei, Strain SHTV-5" /LENGTH=55 /DNA_ID=CAMNT_0051117491 /DNA_START=58 /DNA_END=222 /DNA_ORIENTATION=+